MVFGYDKAAVERAEARAKTRRRLVLGGAVVLVAAALAGALWLQHQYTSVAGLQGVADALTAGTPVRVVFTEVEVHRQSALNPSTWRVALLDVHAEVASPPIAVEAARVEVGVTDLFAARTAAARELHEVTVQGLRVSVGAQPAAEAWEPSEDGGAWMIGTLDLRDAEVTVAADGARPGFDANGISGSLKDLRYTTADRLLSGGGSLKAERAQVGSLALGSPVLEKVVARDGIIGFEGHADLMGAVRPVKGQFAGVGRTVEATGVVEVEEFPMEVFVEAVTGEPGLLRAEVSGLMGIVAGGKRDRGERDLNLEGSFAEGRLVLGDPVQARAVARGVPTTRLQDNGDVALGNLRGKIIGGPAGLEIKQLFAEGPPQTRLRGQLAPDLTLVVRSVDKHEVYLDPGRGVMITRGQDGRYNVRKGTPAELILTAPDAPTD